MRFKPTCPHLRQHNSLFRAIRARRRSLRPHATPAAPCSRLKVKGLDPMQLTSTFPRAFHHGEPNTNSCDFGSRICPTLRKYRATRGQPHDSGVLHQPKKRKHSQLSRPGSSNLRGLESFLRSKLGSGLWSNLKRCMKTLEIGHRFQLDAKWRGLRMSRLTGGSDPAFGCRARCLALVAPALPSPRLNAKQDQHLIRAESRMDRTRIRTGTGKNRHGTCVSKRIDGDSCVGSVCVRRITLTSSSVLRIRGSCSLPKSPR